MGVGLCGLCTSALVALDAVASGWWYWNGGEGVSADAPPEEPCCTLSRSSATARSCSGGAGGVPASCSKELGDSPDVSELLPSGLDHVIAVDG